MSDKRLLILALGGTIAMVEGADGGVTPGLGAAELAAAVPGLGKLAQIDTQTLLRVTSPNLSFADIQQVAARIAEDAAANRIDACIVTQGTDTIEESSFLLDCLLEVRIPVVVTGAMRNPTLASSDGAGNLLAAARVALSDWAIENAANETNGVMVVMLDEAYSAFDAVKVHPTRINAFASPQTGPLAQIVEDRVVAMSRPQREWKRALRFAIQSSRARDSAPSEVALITVGLGDSGALIRAVADDANHLGYKGAVLALMGGGHVPDASAVDTGRLAAVMPVVVTGRMGGGPMLRATYEPVGMEIDLLRRGVIHPGRLGPLKARMLLSVMLSFGVEREGIAEVFANCV